MLIPLTPYYHVTTNLYPLPHTNISQLDKFGTVFSILLVLKLLVIYPMRYPCAVLDDFVNRDAGEVLRMKISERSNGMRNIDNPCVSCTALRPKDPLI